jgi:hypothetical protein
VVDGDAVIQADAEKIVEACTIKQVSTTFGCIF